MGASGRGGVRTRRRAAVLTVAGNDPSGGAGLAADLAVFAGYGVAGAAVVTALTEQGPRGVRSVDPVSSALVGRQLRAALDALTPRAIKVGMLPEAAVVAAVARALAPAARRGVPIVVDPVLDASDGTALLARRDRGALAALLPLAALLTPNLDEAAALLGVRRPAVTADPAAAARALLELGPRAVLVKGGHGGGPRALDVLATADGVRRLSAPRVAGRRAVRGTGCALAAAVAARLARGDELLVAVRRAKRDVRRAIAGARGRRGEAARLDFTVFGR